MKEGFLYRFTQALLYRIVVDTYVDEFLRKGLSQDSWRIGLNRLGRFMQTDQKNKSLLVTA